MGKKLSETEVCAPSATGCCFPVEVFTAAEARHYRDRLEAFERE